MTEHGPYRSAALDEAPSLPPLVVGPSQLWTLRRMDERDRSFVVSTWSDSYHDGSREVRHLAFAAYRDRMHARIERILSRPNAEGVVAVLPDDDDHAIGYVVGEGTTLHYVYVRRARRGYGITRSLLERWMSGHPIVETSHDTQSGARLCRALNASYNPLAVDGAR